MNITWIPVCKIIAQRNSDSFCYMEKLLVSNLAVEPSEFCWFHAQNFHKNYIIYKSIKVLYILLLLVQSEKFPWDLTLRFNIIDALIDDDTCMVCVYIHICIYNKNLCSYRVTY